MQEIDKNNSNSKPELLTLDNYQVKTPGGKNSIAHNLVPKLKILYAHAKAFYIKEEKKHTDRIERKRAEEARKSYFNFFHIDGIVYSASKRKERQGNYIIPVTEFFLKIQNKPDQHFEFEGYDLTIANGHNVCIFYASGKNERISYPINYTNLNLNTSTMLTGICEQVLIESKNRNQGLTRLKFELDRYRKNI